MLSVVIIDSTCFAANVSVNVSATILSKSNCQFTTTSAALNFGSLDPTNPINKSVNIPIQFVCRGSASVATFFISDDDGLYETGPNANRMQHSVNLTTFLPYSISLNPVTGNADKNVNQILTITGTVKGEDYRFATSGSYADVVTLAINP